MATEPERPIEKLLRRYAAQRRAQAKSGFPLSPASRGLLQAEVARRLSPAAQSAAEESPAWWAWLRLWPRLAWSGAALAVLVAAVLIVWLPQSRRDQSSSLMARNDAAPTLGAPPVRSMAEPSLRKSMRQEGAVTKESRSPEPLSARNSASAPAVGGAPRQAQAPAPAAAPQEKRAQNSVAWPPAQSPAPAPAAVAAPASAMASPPSLAMAESASAPPAASGQWGYGAAQSQATRSKADKDRLQVPAGASGSISTQARRELADALAVATPVQEGAPQQQRFTQVMPSTRRRAQSADKTPAANPVLISFQIEQLGQQVRVLDSDGSVYSGSLQAFESVEKLGAQAKGAARPDSAAFNRSASRRESKTNKLSAAKTLAEEALAQSSFFSVTGTSRALNQRVVFSGRLLPLSSAGLAKLKTAPSSAPALGGSTAQFKAPAQVPGGPLSYSEVSGTATMADGTRLEIRALPAAP